MHEGDWTRESLRAALERCEAETALLSGIGEDVSVRRQGINTLRALLREVEEHV